MNLFSIRSVPVLIFIGVASIQADEVSEVIAQAATSYEKQNYELTLQSLTEAVKLVNERIAHDLLVFLPLAPEGWQVEPPVYRSANGQIFEGGNSVSQAYTMDSEQIEVTLCANSPSLPSVLMLLNNPAFLNTDNQRMERLSGQKAIVEWKEIGSGNITVVAGEKVLVSIEGTATTLERLRQFVDAIDLKKLSDLVGD